MRSHKPVAINHCVSEGENIKILCFLGKREKDGFWFAPTANNALPQHAGMSDGFGISPKSWVWKRKGLLGLALSSPVKHNSLEMGGCFAF